jgi:D-sedoheptulose 7-phosphate isomerase
VSDRLSAARRHLADCAAALDLLGGQLPLLERWGADLAARLAGGARLLAAGNGGSAAQAQHLTAELVGRYHEERAPLSAIALHAETSALTAIINDYGIEQMYARQVRAHGRPGDVLVAMSTSGSSPNVLAAAEAARAAGLLVWGFTGARPNPLADRCDEALCIDAEATCTVQEAHLVGLHLLCAALDEHLVDDPTSDRVVDLRGRAVLR